MLTTSIIKMSEKMKQIIEAHAVSACSYEELMNLAYEDGIIDTQERGLLRELHHLIDNGSVRWVPCKAT